MGGAERPHAPVVGPTSDCARDRAGAIVKAMRTILALALAAGTLTVAPAAAANDHDDARDRVSCAGADVRLYVEREEDQLELDLRIDARRGRSFRIVLLRERTLVYSGVRRTSATGRLRIRRAVTDWPGRETVTARVRTPTGRTCVLTATI